MFWHFWVLLQVKLSAEYSAGASGYTTNKLFEAAKKKQINHQVYHIFLGSVSKISSKKVIKNN